MQNCLYEKQFDLHDLHVQVKHIFKYMNGLTRTLFGAERQKGYSEMAYCLSLELRSLMDYITR